jgi:hypothetical protein
MDKSIYEDNVIEGWESTLRKNKDKFYSFNLTNSEFQPNGSKNQKLLDKMKIIVVPELRRFYKKWMD